MPQALELRALLRATLLPSPPSLLPLNLTHLHALPNPPPALLVLIQVPLLQLHALLHIQLILPQIRLELPLTAPIAPQGPVILH